MRTERGGNAAGTQADSLAWVNHPADGRLYMAALGLQAIYDKVISRLEALEAELERRGV